MSDAAAGLPPAPGSATLIVAPSWVGDAVLSQPLIAALSAASDGERTIDVLAPAWVAPVYRRMAGVRKVIDNPFAHGQLRLTERWRLGRSLAGQYQRCWVLPNSLKSALLPWFAGIDERHGFLGEARYGLLNRWQRLDKTRLPRMIDRFMALAPGPAQPQPPRLLTDSTKATAARQRLGLEAHSAVALCPGAEFGPAKRWPEKQYAELAQRLIQRGHAVWLFGSPRDAGVGDKISTLSGARNLCGKTTLEEAIDLMADCQAAISNDSGLMHVAAAVGLPVVALYGSSSPDFTPPMANPAIVLRTGIDCSPCFERTCPRNDLACLTTLAVDQVEEALLRLLNDNPDR